MATAPKSSTGAAKTTAPMATATPAPMAPRPATMPAGMGSPAGRPRSFWISLLLGVVTLGIYFFVWNYKVYKEINAENGWKHEQLWFWLGLIPLVGIAFAIIYHSKELPKLNQARTARGLPGGLEFGQFMLWYVIGLFAVVGYFVAYWKLTNSLNGYWAKVYQTKGAQWTFKVPATPA